VSNVQQYSQWNSDRKTKAKTGFKCPDCGLCYASKSYKGAKKHMMGGCSTKNVVDNWTPQDLQDLDFIKS